MAGAADQPRARRDQVECLVCGRCGRPGRQYGRPPSAPAGTRAPAGAGPKPAATVTTGALTAGRAVKPVSAAPPPSDVSEADEGAWLSPRNLLLLVVLLALIGLVMRRLRERGYKPVTLEREPPAEDTAEPAATANAGLASAGPASPAEPAVGAFMDDAPTPRESEPTPVPGTLTASYAGTPPEPAPEPSAISDAPSGLETPRPDLPLGAAARQQNPGCQGATIRAG